MTNAEFLMKEVKDKGWLYIANVYFDNNLVFFPFTCGGRICMSPSAEMIFSTEHVDSTNSYKLERDFVAQDDSKNGLFQTICCVGFDMLQHFDTHMFAFGTINPYGADEFMMPKVYKSAEIKALTPGDDGLYEGKDTVGFHTGATASTLSLYPNFTKYHNYHGLLIDQCKTFIKNQEAFAKAINKFYGLSDCI